MRVERRMAGLPAHVRKTLGAVPVTAAALGLFLALGACRTAAAAPLTVGAAGNGDVLPEGVTVGGQDLGGMTRQEASQAAADYASRLMDETITLNVGGQAVETTAAELGYTWSNTGVMDGIADIYAGGNLIRQYMTKKDLEKEPCQVSLEFAADDGKLDAFLAEKCAPFVGEAKDAAIKRSGDGFVIEPEAKGLAIDGGATKAAIGTALAGGFSQGTSVDAVVTESSPKVTEADLSTISDVLGTFTTSFNAGNGSRTKNLKTGTGKINGTVLMPGEEFSAYVWMTPFTTANGYAAAASYENGRTVDSIGGGACQICTTLYNAVLLSELEVTQRQNHSMTVAYVDPSTDAAIAGTYKDLKFVNNYETPIYIEGAVNGGSLRFTIYGKETRPKNRTIKYVSETLGVTNPGDPIVKVDASLAPGARVTEQSAHRGLKSRLWKYVYVDGVETEKTILHTDSYAASKSIVRVGPAAVPAVTPVPETPAETAPAPTETPAAPVEGPDGGPGVSQPAGPGADYGAQAPASPASPAGEAAPAAPAPAVPAETGPVSPAGPGA